MKHRGIILLVVLMALMAVAVYVSASASRVLIAGDSLIFRDGSGNELKWQAAMSITPGTLSISSGSGSIVTTTGTETLTNKTLTAPVVTTGTFANPVITDGTEAQIYASTPAGVMNAVTISGDATMTEKGVWTNDKIDNISVDFATVTAGYIQAASGALWDAVVHTLSGDVTGTMDSAGDIDVTISNRYAEMYFHDHSSPLVTTLSAATLANVIGLTNGIATSGMTQNSTNGSITVAASGVFEFVGSMSLEDPDSNSSEYNGTVGVDGTNQEKCEWHRDITVQSKEGSASLSCLLSLSGGAVVTFIVNSADGDDAGWQALNWYLKEF